MHLFQPAILPFFPSSGGGNRVITQPVVGRIGNAGEQGAEREGLDPGSPVVVRYGIDPAGRFGCTRRMAGLRGSYRTSGSTLVRTARASGEEGKDDGRS